MGREIPPWLVGLNLKRNAPRTLAVQLSDSIFQAIASGRLIPGQKLPGTRTLANQLGVHRNTVLTAYSTLQDAGWLESQRGAGTFVVFNLPVRSGPVTRTLPKAPLFELRPSIAVPIRRQRSSIDANIIHLHSIPDPRLLPVAELARAYRRVLRRAPCKLLGYTNPQGSRVLRQAIADLLRTRRSMGTTHDNLIVTRGSQMGLALVAQALLQPGDRVAIESLGYRPAWSALSATGAELVPMPIDAGGLQTDALERWLAKSPLRAIYVTPHHQYPTTVSMRPDRRLRLLQLARRHQIAVIEDDYDNEFHYEGDPLMPLASADDAGVVIYVGTLSKILAPGLRVGFVAAPETLIDRLVQIRLRLDRQGDAIGEAALADFFADGFVARHTRAMRTIYRRRRDVLADALSNELGSVLNFKTPAGGMAIWCTVDPTIDVPAWITAGQRRGVSLPSCYRYEAGRASGLRLGFAMANEQELRVAVDRLKAGLRDL